MTPANQEVLDEIYQELLKDLHAVNVRIEQAEAECESLRDSIRKLQESRDHSYD